jgi:ABC-2 type transport system permease protein
VRTALENLRIPGHVEDFTHGIVDTRQVFFYLTGCILALLFSVLGVEAKLLNS